MNNRKFLGVCILLASVFLTGAVVWHGITTSRSGRYQSITSPETTLDFLVLDTTTGEIFGVSRAKRVDEINSR